MPHTGCQLSTVEKNGTCQTVIADSSADIFSAQNLQSITTENTTINATQRYLARPAVDGDYPTVIMIHECGDSTRPFAIWLMFSLERDMLSSL